MVLLQEFLHVFSLVDCVRCVCIHITCTCTACFTYVGSILIRMRQCPLIYGSHCPLTHLPILIWLTIINKRNHFPKITVIFLNAPQFIICLSFFIIFASSGAKKIQKMENCNFPRVFFHFFIFYHFVYHFFDMFHHFCFQRCKKFFQNGKLQFSSSFFICYHFVYHFLIMLIIF